MSCFRGIRWRYKVLHNPKGRQTRQAAVTWDIPRGLFIIDLGYTRTDIKAGLRQGHRAILLALPFKIERVAWKCGCRRGREVDHA